MPPSKLRKHVSAAIPLAVVAVIGALSVAASAPREAAPTPLELFQRMLPVIRHPRCTNCHGVVDPFTGRNHRGGAIARDPVTGKLKQDCTSCHDDANEWQIPGENHFFAGRTDRQVCAQVSDFVATFGTRHFLTTHVANDDQIVQAFKGLAGGARSPGGKNPDGSIDPPADPPQMKHEEFKKAAQDWVTQGSAACELAGEVTVEESVNSQERVRPTPNTTRDVSQSGTRTVKLTSTGSEFTADITVSGETTILTVQNLSNAQGVPCTVIMKVSEQYSGRTKGPAAVSMKDTTFARTPPTKPPGTDYRVRITLPPEKTTRAQVTDIKDGCGVGLTSSPNDVQQFEWPDWQYMIEGFVEDATLRNAVGGCAKTVMWEHVGETEDATHCNRFAEVGNAAEPWLVNHGANSSFQNGKAIPFQITMTWNLRRR